MRPGFVISFKSAAAVRDPHSFPTRRSSDLEYREQHLRVARENQLSPLAHLSRSEEHTSELQSRGHLVCRLLLEKKNGVQGRAAENQLSPLTQRQRSGNNATETAELRPPVRS